VTSGGAEIRARRAAAYENERPDVQKLVPGDARRILDLGCSSGALGAALKQRQGAEVVGVERDHEYAAAARDRLDGVIEADLEPFLADAGRLEELGSFDCVVTADVLEHLVDPWAALRSAVAVLEPGGSAVVSLPNVRYWETFWQLGIRGRWPRRTEGIFDATHLRWFTLADAYELLDSAGLEVVEVDRMYRLRPSDWRTEAQGRRFARTPLRPFFVFQHLLRGVSRADGH
jgi:methionine biosynthesis protein MetW